MAEQMCAKCGEPSNDLIHSTLNGAAIGLPLDRNKFIHPFTPATDERKALHEAMEAELERENKFAADWYDRRRGITPAADPQKCHIVWCGRGPAYVPDGGCTHCSDRVGECTCVPAADPVDEMDDAEHVCGPACAALSNPNCCDSWPHCQMEPCEPEPVIVPTKCHECGRARGGICGACHCAADPVREEGADGRCRCMPPCDTPQDHADEMAHRARVLADHRDFHAAAEDDCMEGICEFSPYIWNAARRHFTPAPAQQQTQGEDRGLQHKMLDRWLDSIAKCAYVAQVGDMTQYRNAVVGADDAETLFMQTVRHFRDEQVNAAWTAARKEKANG